MARPSALFLPFLRAVKSVKRLVRYLASRQLIWKNCVIRIWKESKMPKKSSNFPPLGSISNVMSSPGNSCAIQVSPKSSLQGSLKFVEANYLVQDQSAE